MKKLLEIFSVVLIAVFLYSAPSQATPLNLTPGTPDVFSAFTDVFYDSEAQLFDSFGFAFELDDDGVGAPEPISGGLISITAAIDNSGNATAGSLVINGTVSTLGYNSGTLLTGNLVDFGFINGGGDPLEFLFDVTGGDAASLYGSTAGVIMSYTGFTGSFISSFSNFSDGVSDTSSNPLSFPVPEPSTIGLFILGIAGLAVTRTFKNKKN